MGLGGELRALAGLKVHHVWPGAGAAAEHGGAALIQHLGGETKGLIALLRAGDGLEHQVEGSSELVGGLGLGGHVGQHTDLGGNLPLALELVEHLQDAGHALHGVVHGVQADDGVAAAQGQALHHGRDDAIGIIGGVVGLQTGGEGAGQTDGGVAVGGHAHLLGGVDEVQVAHQLTHAGNDLRGQAAGGPADHVGGGLGIQQPLAELGHRHILILVKDGLVDRILDDPGHLVLLIGDGGAVAQIVQGQIGEHHLGGHSLLCGFGGNACQLVAGFFLVCLRHDFPNRFELVHMAEQLCLQDHASSPLISPNIKN